MNPSSPTLFDEASQLFHAKYGRQPSALVRAPGRVNLIGEHTDYNDGFVFPFATEASLVFVGSKNQANQLRLFSRELKDAIEIPLDTPAVREGGGWWNYIRGVIKGFQDRSLEIPGVDAVVVGDLPTGAGLSSSAALLVGCTTLIERLAGHSLEPLEKARLCQRAEQDFAGVPCGIMDHYAIIFAQQDHLILLDCRSQESTAIRLVDGEISFLLVDTKVSHSLGDGAYAERRQQCIAAAESMGVHSLRDLNLQALQNSGAFKSDVHFRRARHVLTENERTLASVKAIGERNWVQLGELMYASHSSLRDDYEVSCDELDFLVEGGRRLGLKNGVFGCRMTGGGFGGNVVALVKKNSIAAIAAHLSREYESRFGLQPQTMTTWPSQGVQARRIDGLRGTV